MCSAERFSCLILFKSKYTACQRGSLRSSMSLSNCPTTVVFIEGSRRIQRATRVNAILHAMHRTAQEANCFHGATHHRSIAFHGKQFRRDQNETVHRRLHEMRIRFPDMSRSST